MSTTLTTRPQATRARPGRRQSGVVMLFALIALVIMLVGSVALMRSLNVSLFNVGNIAFKRDMSNQAERVLVDVLPKFTGTGVLASRAVRGASSLPNNYSAKILPTNAQGIPSVLLATDAVFKTVGTGADITPAGQAVAIRYIIERLCDDVGEDALLGASRCILSQLPVPAGGDHATLSSAEFAAGSASAPGKSALPPSVVYRLSVRVTGPRNTLSFFQTTFSL